MFHVAFLDGLGDVVDPSHLVTAALRAGTDCGTSSLDSCPAMPSPCVMHERLRDAQRSIMIGNLASQCPRHWARFDHVHAQLRPWKDAFFADRHKALASDHGTRETAIEVEGV